MSKLTQHQRKRLEEKRKTNKIIQIIFLVLTAILFFFIIRIVFGKIFEKNIETKNESISETSAEIKKETSKEVLIETKTETKLETVNEDKPNDSNDEKKDIQKEVVSSEQNEKKLGNVKDKYQVSEFSNEEIDRRISELPEILREKITKYPESTNTIVRYEDSFENDLNKDISEDLENAKYFDRKVKLPYLSQWDERWAFEKVDDEFIAVSGCGPTTLTAIYSYFTGDTSYNPYTMAQYAYENGWYTSEGGEYPLFTAGPDSLGLNGREISIDEEILKNALDNGEIIVALVLHNGIGDFTQGGHYIIITEYDENNQLSIYDVNSYSNTNKKWDIDRIFDQTKILYSISK